MMGAGTEYRYVVRYDDATPAEVAAYERFQPDHGRLTVLVERDDMHRERRAWPQDADRTTVTMWAPGTRLQY